MKKHLLFLAALVLGLGQLFADEVTFSMQELRASHYHFLLRQFNRQRILPDELRFTPQEITLTADMVNTHFDNISRLSDRISAINPSTANDRKGTMGALFFSRAIEFSLVQDYASAIDDCTKALADLRWMEDGDNKLAREVIYTFCRANWRYKWLDYYVSRGTSN